MIVHSFLKMIKVHEVDEKEAIESSYPGKVISVEQVGKLYVVEVEACSPFHIYLFKRNLREAGFKKLDKKVVVRCLQKLSTDHSPRELP